MREKLTGQASFELTEDAYVFRIPRTQVEVEPAPNAETVSDKLVVVGHMNETLRAAISQEKEWFHHADLRPHVSETIRSQLGKLVSKLTRLGALLVRKAPPPASGRFKQWKITDLGYNVAEMSGATTPPVFLDKNGHPEKPEICLNRMIALCYWAYLLGGVIKPSWIRERINDTLLPNSFAGYFSTAASPDKGKYHRLKKFELKAPHTVLYCLLDDKGMALIHECGDIVRAFEKAGWPFPTMADVARANQIRLEETELAASRILHVKMAA